MTVFLYTATGTDGRNGAGRIDAASLEAARFRLEQQGHTDIVFHTDTHSAQLARAHGHASVASQVSAAQELKNRQKPLRGLAFIIACYRGNWIVWVLPCLWAGLNLFRGPPYTIRAYFSFLLAIAGLIFPLWASIPARAYNALLQASAWARWAEVRSRVAFFRRWGRFFLNSVPALELDVRDACAVAAGGNLVQALKSLEHYAATVQPQSVYYGRIASVYTAARDWSGMARSQAEALRLSNGGTNETIDYATTLIWRLRDADGAEQLLDRSADKELSALAQSFVDFARGLIALERGQAALAAEKLQRALSVQRDLYDNPLMSGMADHLQAYLSIATAQLGDKRAAREMLRGSLPRLTAHKDLDLARRCAAAVA